MREKIHKYIHLFGLCLLTLSIAVSEYVTSISIWILVTNWFFSFRFNEKFSRLKNNKSVLIFLILYLTHVIWLINTSDYSYAFNDLRIKLPLLIFPVIFGSTPKISQKELVLVIKFFILGLLISTLSGLLAYLNIIKVADTDNLRDLSIYISHIRLSLMICLAVFILFYFLEKKILTNRIEQLAAIFIIIWFVWFVFKTQVVTGIVIFLIIGFALLFVKILREKNRKKRVAFLFLNITIPVLILIYIILFVRDFYTPTAEHEQGKSVFTAQNNVYYNDFNNHFLENGNYIYRDICEVELYNTWLQRSSYPLDHSIRNNQILLQTLIRYLTSKGYKKDAEGVMKLSDADIKAIESGRTNYRFKDNAILSERLYGIIWQLDVYRKGGNPSGHSVTQRLEYFKAALIIAYNNFLFGTGTGDIDKAYRSYYSESNTILKPEFQHRAHNQYLTFFVTFGVLGAFLCLFAIFTPVFLSKIGNYYYFGIFFAIALLSMLNEDTLETMAGAVFFGFFYSLFLWSIEYDNK